MAAAVAEMGPVCRVRLGVRTEKGRIVESLVIRSYRLAGK